MHLSEDTVAEFCPSLKDAKSETLKHQESLQYAVIEKHLEISQLTVVHLITELLNTNLLSKKQHPITQKR